MVNRGEVTRRQFALAIGRGGLAVAILATGCSSRGSGGAAPGGVAATGSAASGSPVEALRWQRVNLGFVSAYVLVRGRTAAVVDTGTPGSADAIGQVLDAAGPGWSGVRHVVLTHRHPDHVGSVADVLTRATSATGYIGEADLPQVTSPRPLKALTDGNDVFGLQVVATPGHTAGHVSVFDAQSGLLVVGDALVNTAGLAGSVPENTEDAAAAATSVRRLAELPVRTILFGHGEPLEKDAAADLRRLAKS